MQASIAAASTGSPPSSGWVIAMFSPIDFEYRNGCCITAAIRDRTKPRSRFAIGTSSNQIRPASGSCRRSRRSTMVVLPLPAAPTIATVSPAAIENRMPSSTGSSPWLIETSSKRTLPLSRSTRAGSSGCASTGRSRISSMRPAATSALPNSARIRPSMRTCHRNMLTTEMKK